MKQQVLELKIPIQLKDVRTQCPCEGFRWWRSVTSCSSLAYHADERIVCIEALSNLYLNTKNNVGHEKPDQTVWKLTLNLFCNTIELAISSPGAHINPLLQYRVLLQVANAPCHCCRCWISRMAGHRDKIIWLLIQKILTWAKMAPCRVRSWQHWSWHSWWMVVYVTYPYKFFDSTEKAYNTVLE